MHQAARFVLSGGNSHCHSLGLALFLHQVAQRPPLTAAEQASTADIAATGQGTAGLTVKPASAASEPSPPRAGEQPQPSSHAALCASCGGQALGRQSSGRQTLLLDRLAAQVLEDQA